VVGEEVLEQLREALHKVNGAAGARKVLHTSLTEDGVQGVAKLVEGRSHLVRRH
jgi:hypothetical protein